MKRLNVQQVKVLSEELLVHLSSCPRGANGDECVEAAETNSCKMRSKRAGRNASEARASLEMERCRRRADLEAAKTAETISAKNQREGSSVDRGNGRSTHVSMFRRHGRPVLRQDKLQTAEEAGHAQESEGLVVPKKSVNADGGKGPWFRVRLGEPRIWRST